MIENAGKWGGRRAVFRCEASVELGGGHVMRCLTLARALRVRGWWCAFAVSAETAGIVPRLRVEADAVLTLDVDEDVGQAEQEALAIGEWVCGHADLLVIDHYQRDARFAGLCRLWADRILVIDDLADRPHDADLLLDQTWGRTAADYASLLPVGCRSLCGAEFTLLRPSFAALRAAALRRRSRARPPQRLLVSLGATDPGNLTAAALAAIADSRLGLVVDVVLGAGAPHQHAVARKFEQLAVPATLHVGVGDIAPLMATADLAIGAGGTGAWERCCLGLPTLMMVAADNQRLVARRLSETGACRLPDEPEASSSAAIATLLRAMAGDEDSLSTMAAAAARITDGEGMARVVAEITALFEPGSRAKSALPAPPLLAAVPTADAVAWVSAS